MDQVGRNGRDLQPLHPDGWTVLSLCPDVGVVRGRTHTIWSGGDPAGITRAPGAVTRPLTLPGIGRARTLRLLFHSPMLPNGWWRSRSCRRGDTRASVLP